MSTLIEDKISQKTQESFNVVFVGHVDHGKSTVIGRLLADTNSLPQGKLESIKESCRKNAKPFEYAFLLDALQNEQSQGITIDTARCFFKSEKRDYIIIDAPGHIEFLKNMVTGAARAEAAVLVIDAQEGVQENSRRHGYMLSMLGIRQVAVLINKMDLIEYNQSRYEEIKSEYNDFLQKINLTPKAYLPVCAREGDNLVFSAHAFSWYKGDTLLEVMDSFENAENDQQKPFRFPVQDIYKFTEERDDRRIIAGRVESGTLSIGDSVQFFPSQKKAVIKSIEGFNSPDIEKVSAGQSTGFTLEPEIYIKPGAFMVREEETAPLVASRFRVNIFWMSKNPLIKNRQYKIKLTTSESPVWLAHIHNILDASELTSVKNKNQVDLYDVADCVLETTKPLAFDPVYLLPKTGRFVIVDNYEIAGGGIVSQSLGKEQKLLEEYIERREKNWERSSITPGVRFNRYNHKSIFMVLTGTDIDQIRSITQSLEEVLFNQKRFVYLLGLSNSLLVTEANTQPIADRYEYIRHLGEIAYLFTDAGAILLTTLPDLEDHEFNTLKALTSPNKIEVVNIGEKKLLTQEVSLHFKKNINKTEVVNKIYEFLQKQSVVMEYYI